MYLKHAGGWLCFFPAVDFFFFAFFLFSDWLENQNIPKVGRVFYSNEVYIYVFLYMCIEVG